MAAISQNFSFAILLQKKNLSQIVDTYRYYSLVWFAARKPTFFLHYYYKDSSSSYYRSS